MTVEGQATSDEVAPPGTVVGAPRRWLLLEGMTLLVGSVLAFSTTHESWWFALSVLLVPDIFAAGRESGVEWYVYEQDNCYGDPFGCARASLEFMTHQLQ